MNAMYGNAADMVPFSVNNKPAGVANKQADSASVACRWWPGTVFHGTTSDFVCH